jgi:hypothetical protein
MKKIAFLLAALMAQVCTAEQMDENFEMTSKIICSNGEGYFTLADGSFWKVVPFEKRWRTLSEWWNNVDLIPDNYDAKPSDWHPGAKVEILEKASNFDVDEANAGNKDAIRKCTHLLKNKHNDQVLFAISLLPSTYGVEIYSQAFKDGYAKGEVDAASNTYIQRDAAYRRGHSDGYTKGYQEAARRFASVNNQNAINNPQD